MKKNFSNVVVQENSTISSIIKKINQNGKNGVFVSNKKKKIVGIITDADIRKKLLQDKILVNQRASSIMEKNFYSIPFSKRNKKKKLLLESNKILIPILKNNFLKDFAHLSDIMSKNNSAKKKILVIGGLGYIGSVLIDHLLKKNYSVNILDINFYGCNLSKKTLKNSALKIFYGDCNSLKKLRKAIKGCTDVIHLGEIVGDPAVSLDRNFSIKNNYDSTVAVVSECLKNKIDKFIFASSCSVYGSSTKECCEKSKLNPVSLYARCKIECEKTILSFKKNSFCPVILRLSTVYGDSPRKRFDLVVNRFILMAIKKIRINLFGGSSWRPFISVNDVSRAILKILTSKNDVVSRQIFNLGGDKENYRIKDIIHEIKKKIKVNFKVTKQVDDKRNYKVSFKKIQKKINFQPKDNLKKSIAELLNKYKKSKINISNINYYNDKKISKILIN